MIGHFIQTSPFEIPVSVWINSKTFWLRGLRPCFSPHPVCRICVFIPIWIHNWYYMEIKVLAKLCQVTILAIDQLVNQVQASRYRRPFSGIIMKESMAYYLIPTLTDLAWAPHCTKMFGLPFPASLILISFCCLPSKVLPKVMLLTFSCETAKLSSHMLI